MGTLHREFRKGVILLSATQPLPTVPRYGTGWCRSGEGRSFFLGGGAHKTLPEEQVVSTDTGQTRYTATMFRMSSWLITVVAKYARDSSSRVDVGHLHTPAKPSLEAPQSNQTKKLTRTNILKHLW